jgi:hypothetical protein
MIPELNKRPALSVLDISSHYDQLHIRISSQDIPVKLIRSSIT